MQLGSQRAEATFWHTAPHAKGSCEGRNALLLLLLLLLLRLRLRLLLLRLRRLLLLLLLLSCALLHL
jgi:hypothetical protein